MYRGGDIGRWLPDGKLEFLGRRDSQVKIRGFRIEIGEIENALLGADGVRQGAVVVSGTGYDTHLVAFYASAGRIDEERLSAHLRRSLPSYMIPSAFHRREKLPQTANSKIDYRALTLLADELDDQAQVHGPTSDGRMDDLPLSASELRVSAAWAVVLGVPQDKLGRDDHFFERGGTSLSAVKLAIILNRVVTHRDIVQRPTLSALADLLEQRTSPPAVEQNPA
jgi:hypothetical protein